MLADEIRSWLAAYLQGDISLEAFEDWFLPGAWDSPLYASEEVRSLAAGIRLRLAEYDNSDWTEEELRGMLAVLIVTPFAHSMTATGSAATDNEELTLELADLPELSLV